MLADRGVSPALLEAVVRAATHAIIAIDAGQRIVLFNAAAEAMFGCPAEEAIGSSLDRFLPERFRGLHRRHVSMFAATGETARAMGHLRPLTALRATGEEFPIEATISRAEVDGVMYLTAIVRDMTNVRRVEAELRRRAELLDNAHDAVLAWEWGGTITYWNRGAERLYGFAPHEALGRTTQDLLGIAPDAASAASEALDDEGHWEGEQTHTARDGRRLLVETRQVLVRDGAVGHVLEADRDITARRTAERERTESLARETAARFQAEVSSALAGSLHYESTLNKIAEVAVRILGDACFIDIVEDGRIRRVAAVHRDEAKQPLAEALARRFPPDWDAPMPGPTALRRGEPVLLPAIGPTELAEFSRDANHRAMLTAFGLRSALAVPMVVGGRALGCLTIMVTEPGRSLGETELRYAGVVAERAAMAIENARLDEQIDKAKRLAEQQLHRLRAILDNLPMAVILLAAPDGRVDIANAAANSLIFGEESWKGAALRDLNEFDFIQANGLRVPRDLRPGVRALRHMTVRNQQLLLEGADGRRTPVLVQATPLGAVGGDSGGAVLVIQDITRLREAEQLKDDFLALLSHEFRTPLTAIQGGAQLLATEGAALDDETRQELVLDIALESERLDQMLGNMLSLADILAGRLESSTEPVLVEPLVHQAVREMERRAPRHHFVIDIPNDLPPVEADPALCAQILRNLYENAVKYAPDGGEIRTTAGLVDDMVRIAIRDQGIGIAPEYVTTVFERFRRVGGNPAVRGMGLGLYLVRHLVEAQGGHVSAQSPGLGKGTTISVGLPVARVLDRHDRLALS